VVGACHEHDVLEPIADFLAQIRNHAVTAVARQIGVDHDRAVLLSLQFLDRIPSVGCEIRLEVEAFARFLDGGGDERIVFDDEEFHAYSI